MNFNEPLRELQETTSTNDVVKGLALDGAPEGTVVTAACQTGGRGRHGRSWVSPPGKGLFYSILLRPDWPAAEAPRLGILMGVAVYRLLQEAGIPNLSIKWPNDVQAAGRKIAGILVEPRISGGRIEFAVAGIGVNVGYEQSDFPPELQGRVTSCRMEGIQTDVAKLGARLTQHIEEEYALACSGGFDQTKQRWIQAGGRDEMPEIGDCV